MMREKIKKSRENNKTQNKWMEKSNGVTHGTHLTVP